MLNYAAYLRVYEPVSAFHEPDRSRWAAYVVSSTRPRRRDALAAEHAERLRLVVVVPPEEAQAGDGAVEHAYVRSADDVSYVCPWQLELRSLLAHRDEGALPAGARPPYIRQRSWAVPLAWFVPFAGDERWFALGARGQPGQHGVDLRAPAQVARTLVYLTPMSRARRRIARGLAVLRGSRRPYELPEPGIELDLAVVGRWLETFHPYSLVELDYGGLVHLLTDEALAGDESAAEMGAAIDGMSRGHCEVALAMYRRAQARWQAFGEFEQVN